VTSARPDSRYLATVPITTDLSQRATNLTPLAPGGYELMSARLALNGSGAGRSIELACEINNVVVGILVDHTAGGGYRIRVNAGGVVVFSNSSGTKASITAPNVAAGAKDYIVAWSTEPNPATTGAADAQRSEFLVYDVAGAALAWTSATHSQVNPSSAGTFAVGGTYSGGVLNSPYGLAIDAIRISNRFHTRVETREHFVAATPAPTPSGPVAVQLVTPPEAMLEPGELVGPGYQLAAASMATTRDRHRLVSPVWQWTQQQPVVFTDNMRTSIGPRHVWDLEDGYQNPISMLARRRIPRHVAWLRVIVQWATWKINPVNPMDAVDFRFHTADGKPNNYTRQSFKLISRNIDDVSPAGLGVLQVMEFIPVERDDAGYTWLWPSIRTDSGSGMGNAAYSIRSISATPIVLPEGFDFQLPNAWGP